MAGQAISKVQNLNHVIIYVGQNPDVSCTFILLLKCTHINGVDRYIITITTAVNFRRQTTESPSLPPSVISSMKRGS